MAEFFTRVELHGAEGNDYDVLHSEMLKRNFYRAIIGHDGETKFGLPSATYHSADSSTAAETMGRAREAADVVGRSHWVLTVEAASWAGYLKVIS